MPVSPKRQAELRARRKDTPELEKIKCPNCGKKTPKTSHNKRFCSGKCKMEWFRFGAAYGPLKEKLEKLIEETIATRYHALDERLRMVSEGFAALDAREHEHHQSSQREIDAVVQLAKDLVNAGARTHPPQGEPTPQRQQPRRVSTSGTV